MKTCDDRRILKNRIVLPNVLLVHTILNKFKILFIFVTDNLAAGEATDRNDHLEERDGQITWLSDKT